MTTHAQSGMNDSDTLRTDILAANPDDERLFHSLFNRLFTVLALTEREAAHEFNMSLPSIRRWLSGRNAPLPVMRPFVYRRMVSTLDRKTTRADGVRKMGPNDP